MKTFKIITGLCILLLAVSCQRDIIDMDYSESQNHMIIKVTTGNEPDTRINLNGVSVKWSATDSLYIAQCGNSESFDSQVLKYSIIPSSISADGKSAEFKGPILTKGKDYIAFHPRVFRVNEGTQYGNEQTGLIAKNILPSCQDDPKLILEGLLMTSGRIQFKNSDSQLEFKLAHCTSIVNLNIKLANNVNGTHKIKEVIFESVDSIYPFAKNIFINSSGVQSVPEEQRSNQITGFFSEAIPLNKTNYVNVQLISWWNTKVTPPANGSFKITVITDENKQTSLYRPAKVLEPGKIYNANLVFDEPIQYDANNDRAALEEIYNLTKGQAWYKNTNWCSNKPLNEWWGVTTDAQGRVIELDMAYNNVRGQLTAPLRKLSKLRKLNLNSLSYTTWYPDGRVENRPGQPNYITDIDVSFNYELQFLDIAYNKINKIDVSKNKLLESLYIDYCNIASIDFTNNSKLKILEASGNPVKSIDLSNSTALEKLSMIPMNIPSSSECMLKELILENCKELKYIDISGYEGTVDFTKMTKLEEIHWYDPSQNRGCISSIDLSKNTALKTIRLDGKISSPPTIDLSNNLNLEYIRLWNFSFPGNHANFNSFKKLSKLDCSDSKLESIRIDELSNLKELCVRNNNLTSLDVTHNPQLIVITCYENKLTTIDITHNSVLQNLSCFKNQIEGDFEELFTSFIKSRSFYMLDCHNNNITGNVPATLVTTYRPHQIGDFKCCENKMSGVIPIEVYNHKDFRFENESHSKGVVDRWHLYGGWCFNPQKPGYGLTLPTGGLYESTDYSEDGKIVKLQSATKGGGVDIVFMGDAFTDKDMGTGGNYERAIKEAIKHFFAIEPTKSYRDYFNIYMVKVVSKNGEISNLAKTALSTRFGDGTNITGNDSKVMQYASNIPGVNIRNTPLIVVMNSPKYAGTTYTYTDGASIAYCPMSTRAYPSDFRGLIQHEGIGHAFGRLLDEYVYYNQTITGSYINDFNRSRTSFNMGWNMTLDKSDVPWQHFIGHPKYPMVGLYEGGYFFSKGVWRAENNHCMNNNVPYFNGPSRELIVKRIKQTAGQPYSWSDFVAADKIEEPTRTMTRAAQDFIPLAQPVFVNKTSKEVLENR